MGSRSSSAIEPAGWRRRGYRTRGAITISFLGGRLEASDRRGHTAIGITVRFALVAPSTAEGRRHDDTTFKEREVYLDGADVFCAVLARHSFGSI